MATPYSWPITLPECPRKDFKESHNLNILVSPMDAGPAKLRRRSLKPSKLQVSYEMTSAQVLILETFVFDTIRGTSRFNWTHPRTSTVVEVRIVPESEGKMYDISYFGFEMWTITMTLEVLP